MATAAPTATVLLVFGQGVTHDGERHLLTAGSAARVRAAVDYVEARRQDFTRAAEQHERPRIVFAGGWAEASAAAACPPAGSREGDLMLDQARAAGLDRHAELCCETRSRSTLENLLHTVEDGLLAGHDFSPSHPLGLVSHGWHLPRVRFLAGKVLGLRGAALLDVPAAGGEPAGRWRSERVVRLAARLCFLGACSPEDLLRRERRWVESIGRRRPPPA